MSRHSFNAGSGLTPVTVHSRSGAPPPSTAHRNGPGFQNLGTWSPNAPQQRQIITLSPSTDSSRGSLGGIPSRAPDGVSSPSPVQRRQSAPAQYIHGVPPWAVQARDESESGTSRSITGALVQQLQWDLPAARRTSKPVLVETITPSRGYQQGEYCGVAVPTEQLQYCGESQQFTGSDHRPLTPPRQSPSGPPGSGVADSAGQAQVEQQLQQQSLGSQAQAQQQLQQQQSLGSQAQAQQQMQQSLASQATAAFSGSKSIPSIPNSQGPPSAASTGSVRCNIPNSQSPPMTPPMTPPCPASTGSGRSSILIPQLRSSISTPSHRGSLPLVPEQAQFVDGDPVPSMSSSSSHTSSTGSAPQAPSQNASHNMFLEAAGADLSSSSRMEPTPPPEQVQIAGANTFSPPLAVSMPWPGRPDVHVNPPNSEVSNDRSSAQKDSQSSHSASSVEASSRVANRTPSSPGHPLQGVPALGTPPAGVRAQGLPFLGSNGGPGVAPAINASSPTFGGHPGMQPMPGSQTQGPSKPFSFAGLGGKPASPGRPAGYSTPPVGNVRPPAKPVSPGQGLQSNSSGYPDISGHPSAKPISPGSSRHALSPSPGSGHGIHPGGPGGHSEVQGGGSASHGHTKFNTRNEYCITGANRQIDSQRNNQTLSGLPPADQIPSHSLPILGLPSDVLPAVVRRMEPKRHDVPLLGDPLGRPPSADSVIPFRVIPPTAEDQQSTGGSPQQGDVSVQYSCRVAAPRELDCQVARQGSPSGPSSEHPENWDMAQNGQDSGGTFQQSDHPDSSQNGQNGQNHFTEWSAPPACDLPPNDTDASSGTSSDAWSPEDGRHFGEANNGDRLEKSDQPPDILESPTMLEGMLPESQPLYGSGKLNFDSVPPNVMEDGQVPDEELTPVQELDAYGSEKINIDSGPSDVLENPQVPDEQPDRSGMTFLDSAPSADFGASQHLSQQQENVDAEECSSSPTTISPQHESIDVSLAVAPPLPDHSPEANCSEQQEVHVDSAPEAPQQVLSETAVLSSAPGDGDTSDRQELVAPAESESCLEVPENSVKQGDTSDTNSEAERMTGFLDPAQISFSPVSSANGAIRNPTKLFEPISATLDRLRAHYEANHQRAKLNALAALQNTTTVANPTGTTTPPPAETPPGDETAQMASSLGAPSKDKEDSIGTPNFETRWEKSVLSSGPSPENDQEASDHDDPQPQSDARHLEIKLSGSPTMNGIQAPAQEIAISPNQHPFRPSSLSPARYQRPQENELPPTSLMSRISGPQPAPDNDILQVQLGEALAQLTSQLGVLEEVLSLADRMGKRAP